MDTSARGSKQDPQQKRGKKNIKDFMSKHFSWSAYLLVEDSMRGLESEMQQLKRREFLSIDWFSSIWIQKLKVEVFEDAFVSLVEMYLRYLRAACFVHRQDFSERGPMFQEYVHLHLPRFLAQTCAKTLHGAMASGCLRKKWPKHRRQKRRN